MKLFEISVISQNSTYLIYFAAEVWNHARNFVFPSPRRLFTFDSNFLHSNFIEMQNSPPATLNFATKDAHFRPSTNPSERPLSANNKFTMQNSPTETLNFATKDAHFRPSTNPCERPQSAKNKFTMQNSTPETLNLETKDAHLYPSTNPCERPQSAKNNFKIYQ